jgi:CRP/FNR family transcriptional regulator, cyclic AMP receptor protein
MARGVSQDQRIQLLKSMWLFSHCDRKELQKIAALTTLDEAHAGDVVARQGERGSECFIVASGTATIHVGGADVGRVGPGDFFGEMALLDGGPRSATVTAADDMQLLILDRRELNDLLDAAPSVARKMLAVLGQRLREAHDRNPLTAEATPGG